MVRFRFIGCLFLVLTAIPNCTGHDIRDKAGACVRLFSIKDLKGISIECKTSGRLVAFLRREKLMPEASDPLYKDRVYLLECDEGWCVDLCNVIPYDSGEYTYETCKVSEDGSKSESFNNSTFTLTVDGGKGPRVEDGNCNHEAEWKTATIVLSVLLALGILIGVLIFFKDSIFKSRSVKQDVQQGSDDRDSIQIHMSADQPNDSTGQRNDFRVNYKSGSNGFQDSVTLGFEGEDLALMEALTIHNRG